VDQSCGSQCIAVSLSPDFVRSYVYVDSDNEFDDDEEEDNDDFVDD
jgi:hypothetical protein